MFHQIEQRTAPRTQHGLKEYRYTKRETLSQSCYVIHFLWG
jgi:hypothetical protein